MRKRSFKVALSIIFMVLFIFSITVYAVTYESSNNSELESIILRELNLANPNFNVTYTGLIEEIDNTMKNILQKDPYLSCTVTSIKWTTSSTGNGIYNVNVNATHVSTAYEKIETDKIIENIISTIITPQMTDHEKVKAVHDYIVLNSEYDTSHTYYSDYNLLTQAKSVCNGYALLTYNMLNKLNIPTKFVFGSSDSESHVWNMVKLGDNWFHLDTTWNDPVPNMENIVSYDYYMLTDNEILENHIMAQNQNLPVSKTKYYDYLNKLSSSTLNSYIYKSLLVETGLYIYDEENTAVTIEELKDILENKIKVHPSKISLRFSSSLSEDDVNTAMSALFNNEFVSEIHYDQFVSDSTGNYKILNLYIKYKETPDNIITDLSNNIYNTATKVDLNVYAIYGKRKDNITKNVMIYPYDTNFINISGSTLTFKDAGSQNLIFEYGCKKAVVNITSINSKGFEYITEQKPNSTVNVKVFDKYIDFSIINQWPFIENNRTLVPLRAVFEVLNCSVEWDNTKNSAVVEHGPTKIVIPANSQTAYVNGIAKSLDTPAKLVNNRIMVPLRFISEAINKTVIWDDINKTVLIY